SFNRAAHLSLAGYLATPPRHLSPNNEGSVVSLLSVPFFLMAYRSPRWELGRQLIGRGLSIGLGCATGIFTRRLSTLLREVLPVSRRACLPRSE
ncbi:hypothetical protein Chor_011006, partial [Crotalus horridus]